MMEGGTNQKKEAAFCLTANNQQTNKPIYQLTNKLINQLTNNAGRQNNAYRSFFF